MGLFLRVTGPIENWLTGSTKRKHGRRHFNRNRSRAGYTGSHGHFRVDGRPEIFHLTEVYTLLGQLGSFGPKNRRTNAGRPVAMRHSHFWKHTPLNRMSLEQWECLCDGCAQCCLNKFEDADTGGIQTIPVACRHLDITRCRCRIYFKRTLVNPDCFLMTPDNLSILAWLPETCAYRRIAEGKDLPDWHPLVTGDPQSVHRAGISVRDRVVSEAFVHPEDLAWYGTKG